MRGENAIAGVRALMGATNPADSAPGTIRGDLATLLSENVVHGSDSRKSAQRELELFFPDGLAGAHALSGPPDDDARNRDAWTR